MIGPSYINPATRQLIFGLYSLLFVPQFVAPYAIFYRAELNCSQLCSCHHNALVNTMKQYNDRHFSMMGEQYRPQSTLFDIKSEYMHFLGTFAPIMHKIAEITCSISDGMNHTIMSLINGVDDFMDTALEVTCANGETLIWDVPSWDINVNIFFSKNCNIVPDEERKFVVIPMNVWVFDVVNGGVDLVSLIDIKYTMNTLTLSLTGTRATNTPIQWDDKYMISAAFINLINNKLNEFHCPLKFTKRLDTLNLEKNRLTQFPECLLDSRNIQVTYLSLAHNKIVDITLLFEKPESASEPEITIINLSYNHIKSIEAIRNMGKLIVLDLSHNEIKDLTDDAFENLLFMKVLYLSNNKIHTLGQQQFTKNIMLGTLDLSHNSLTLILPEQLPITSQTFSLDARHNKLPYPTLKDCAKKKIETMNIKLYMAGNPFFCDCNMIEFEDCQELVKNKYINYSLSDGIFKDLDSLMCANPFENKNILLSDLSFHSKCIIVEGCPLPCSCMLLNVKRLIVNCSGRRLLEMPDSLPSYPGAITAVYFDHNPLQILSHRPYLRRLSELYMDNCLLTSVTPTAMASLQNIRVLTLHNNLLQKLPSSTRNITLNDIKNLTLHNNRWACTCDSLWLPRWITKHKSSLWMSSSIVCHYLRKPVEELSEMDLNCSSSSFIDTFISFTLLISSLVSTFVIGICYRSEISVLVHSKLGLRLNGTIPCGSFFSPYDAFISYCQDTANWVENILKPRLECGPYKYRLCFHFRDFPKGDYVLDSIPGDIRMSRCVALILSKEVIKKEWCLMEVRASFQRLLLVSNKVIIIAVDDFDINKLPPDMCDYMKKNNYLSFEDPCFWEKLESMLPSKFACPSTESSLIALTKRGGGDSLACSTPDKFEDTVLTDLSESSLKQTEITDGDA